MHNNTLVLPVTWYFDSKTWSDFNEILLEPKCSLDGKVLWNFSEISLNSNHDTTEYNSFTAKIELLAKFR